jgi:4-alpha-glucanotransferase
LDTHDTPTFAAHWRGDDLLERVRLGLLPRTQLKRAKKERNALKAALIRFLKSRRFLKHQKPDAGEVLHALLSWLRAGKAEMVLVNIEDLWLETQPQNVPGTSSERPNWRRKARLALEQILQDRELRKVF